MSHSKVLLDKMVYSTQMYLRPKRHKLAYQTKKQFDHLHSVQEEIDELQH